MIHELSAFTRTRCPLSGYDGLELVTEASALGWKPGEAMTSIKVRGNDDSILEVFYVRTVREAGEVVAFIYEQGKVTVKVFND